MAIEKIDEEKCSGCKTCVSVCPMDVIRFNEDEEKPYIAYQKDCIDCCACEAYCPLACILVMPTKEFHVPAPY